MGGSSDAAGHEGTPEHGLHGDAEDVDEEQEGSYVDIQEEGDEETTHPHPPKTGTYVEVAHEKGEPPVDPQPEPGHYVDRDEDTHDGEP